MVSESVELKFNSVEMDDVDEEGEVDDAKFYVGGNGGKVEYTKCHSIPKSADRSIMNDLEKLNLPEDVKLEAERIFHRLSTSTKRGKRRKKLLFYCIFNAYNMLGQPQDPKFIAELVDISPTEMTKAFSMCSEIQTNYRPPNIHKTPLDFLPQHIQRVGLDSTCTDDIMALGSEVLLKDPELYEHYPQVVAAGILLYYLTINGISVDKKKFAELFRRSEMTIVKMFKRISQVHNE